MPPSYNRDRETATEERLERYRQTNIDTLERIERQLVAHTVEIAVLKVKFALYASLGGAIFGGVVTLGIKAVEHFIK